MSGAPAGEVSRRTDDNAVDPPAVQVSIDPPAVQVSIDPPAQKKIFYKTS